MVVAHLIGSILLHVLSLFKERIFIFIEIFNEQILTTICIVTFRVRYFISYLLHQTKFGLYLHFSNLFGTKRNFVLCQIIRNSLFQIKMLFRFCV